MKHRLLSVFASALLLLAACGAPSQKPAEPEADAPQTASAEAKAEAAPAEAAPAEAPAIAPPPTLADSFDWPVTQTRATIVTSKGDFVIELYPDKAPKTVANFIQYARDGHYDRLIFHRVVAGFVIQGGGYNQYYAERPTRAPVPYEGDNGLKNYRTTVAMARTMDPNSAAAQWYVNLRDNGDLDHFANDLGPRYGYTVFGRVIEGMDVVDAIGAVPTGAGGPFEAEAPVERVVISRVEIVEPATP
jgi:cyclophilin family peptidyl-prolyl cis-trans isomerase